jgi:hypothetical protein
MFIAKCGLCCKSIKLPDKAQNWPYAFACNRCDKIVRFCWNSFFAFIIFMGLLKIL